MPKFTFHIVWTTYGTWLPGDERGWIEKGTVGIRPPDLEREQQARDCMSQSVVLLSPEQRALAEETIRLHCKIRRWYLHAVNARSNHVHLVVTADRPAKVVMNEFKAWCSRKLSDAAGLSGAVAIRAGRRRWFTEGGNAEVIEDEQYLQNAIRYVLEGQ